MEFRFPRIVPAKKSPPSRGIVADFLFGVVTSAVQSFRAPDEAQEGANRRPMDAVTCADTSGSTTVVGFLSGGFGVWDLTTSEAIEVVCETGESLASHHVRLIRLKSQLDVIWVDSKRSCVVRFYSPSVSSELEFERSVESLSTFPSSLLLAVGLSDGSASVVDCKTQLILSVVGFAVPICVSLRWYAFGARTEESRSILGELAKSVSSQVRATLLSSADSGVVANSIVVRDGRNDVCTIASETSFLAFDPSGSFLVSGSPDGQSLTVVSLPLGVPKVKLERGFSAGVFVHSAFNPSRTLLAVTTARGTTHLFPVNLFETEEDVPTVRARGKIYEESVLALCFVHESVVRIVSSLDAITDFELLLSSSLSGPKSTRTWDVSREENESRLVTSNQQPEARLLSHKYPLSSGAASKFEAHTFEPHGSPTWRSPGFELRQAAEEEGSKRAFSNSSLTCVPHTTVIGDELMSDML